MGVQETEATKVSVRSIRKHGMVAVKQLASEDERFSAEREVSPLLCVIHASPC